MPEKNILEGTLFYERLREIFENPPVYCKACGQMVSFKQIDERGSFTSMCGCGCEIMYHKDKDKYHDRDFFLRVYKPAAEYKKNYAADACGFKVEERNGKKVLVK